MKGRIEMVKVENTSTLPPEAVIPEEVNQFMDEE